MFLLLFFGSSLRSGRCFLCRSSFCGWLRLLNREINFYESTRWTLIYTFGTHTALVEIDISHVVLDSDGLKLADFLALAASDASSATSLSCHSTLVFVDATHIDATTLRTLLAKFDDVTWTSLGASTATRTLLFIYLRETCLRVDGNSSELAGSDTVAATEATESTTRLASTTRVHGGASVQTIILGDARAMLARAITTNYRYLGFCIGYSDSKEVGYFAHHVGTTYRTHQSFDAASISTLDQGPSHA